MNRKIGAVLVLVATFILGGLAGGVLHYLYRNQVAPTTVAQVQSARPPGDIVQDMAKSLGLDDGQKQELRRIFEQSREKYRALSLQFRPQYDALRRETDGQIRRILRKDQVALYDQLLKEGRERHKSTGPNIGPKGNGRMPPPQPLPPRNQN
jgi:uncharacterized membrane protein